MQRLIRPLTLSMIAAVAVYGGMAILADVGTLDESAAKLGATGWVIVLALTLANQGIRFVRWQFYLHRLGAQIDAAQSLLYYMGGFAFTVTPGKAGEAIRSLYLKRHGMSYADSLAALFAERLLDLAAVLLLALFAILIFPGFRWTVAVIALLLLAFLPLIHAPQAHRLLEYITHSLPSLRLRALGTGLATLLRAASDLLKSGPLYGGLFLGLVAWAAQGVAFHIIVSALGIEVGWLLSIGIYSTAILIGALSFIPGGLGSTEAVMILLLTVVGSDTPTAVAATLICRLATLWFAVLIGILALAVVELRHQPAENPPTPLVDRE